MRQKAIVTLSERSESKGVPGNVSKTMQSSWVYIVECADGSYYTGATINLEQRIGQHNSGTFDGYTSSRRPVKVLWSQEFTDIRDSIEAERTLKKWTRAKKEALMRGDFELLTDVTQNGYVTLSGFGFVWLSVCRGVAPDL